MTCINAARQSWRAPGFFTLALLLAAPAAAAPPVLDVVGGNSANGNLLWLNFEDGVAEETNNDANQRVSLRSFEFFKNTCDITVDVVAADTNSSALVLYTSGAGTGVPLCTGGGCPARPDGLSSSNERLMSVAQTGAAGTTPEVWFFKPADCGGSGGPFEAGVSGGQFKVSSSGAATPVEDIADTEFVKVPGGGFAAGDLLVLTHSPTTISRVRAADIAALLANGTSLPAADIVLDETFFSTEDATGLAFVPGTAGIGAANTDSESEDLLVTLSPGRVLRLTFVLSDNSIVLKPTSQAGATPLARRIFVDNLGNGPLGIAAGTRNASTYMIVADRQRGTFYRYELIVGADTSLTVGAVSSIKAGVQNPQGAAINSDAYDAADCDRAAGGCQIRKSVELLFTQEVTDITDTVFANIYVITDPRGSGGTINLKQQVSDQFDSKFNIPASCRGFALPDDPSTSVLLVMDIKKNFSVTAGEFAQGKETIDDLIPELEGCETTGARLFYHQDPGSNGNFPTPTPENGTLYDATFFCSNPSRSITPNYSPLVICADPYYLELAASSSKPKLKGKLARTAGEQVTYRVDNLQQVVNVLPASSLKTTLNAALNEVRKAIRRNLEDVWMYFEQGALAVYDAENPGGYFSGSGAPTPDTLYGDLLGRFLAAAFYSRETLSGGFYKYCPPASLVGPDGVVIPAEEYDATCGS